MMHRNSKSPGIRCTRFWLGLIAALFLVALTIPSGLAQVTSGSLYGTVRDATGAVVTNANITLTNDATQDVRNTQSNSAGYFNLTAVPLGTYSVTISANGFANWKLSGLSLGSGDMREITSIVLQIGKASQTIAVTADAEQLISIDSGNHAAVLSSEDMKRLSIEGRDVSELLKVLPGMTMMANGVSGGSSVDFSKESPVGSAVGDGYSPSGAPYRGGSTYMLDGANIIDPGCNCYSIAVPNPDMTAEVKVDQAFGADTQNGPVIINSTSKAGGSNYHGMAYFYARNQALNSNTWLNNYSNTAKPSGQYYYPGFNVGGPILIPHTRFEKKRNLLFWFGYEYYKQTLPQASPLESYVPTDGMKAGNFTASGSGNSTVCSSFNASSSNWCNNLTGGYNANGVAITNPAAIPVDSGAAALMKLFPEPNANPASTPGGYNYVEGVSSTQNGYVYRARVDYNVNDNTKIFGTFQQGVTTFVSNSHVWWTPSYSILYPGGNIDTPTTSRVATFNMINILSPTMTNEFIFGWGWANEPFKPTNLSAMYKSTLDYPYQTVYNSASSVAPSINSPGAQTFPDISQPAFFNSAGIYPEKKAIPTFSDNLTKIWKTHSFKFGGFTELVGNEQGTWAYPNGQLSYTDQPLSNVVTGSSVSATTKIGTYNPTANFVMGIASSFSQNNSLPLEDMAYRTTSVYGMDNWKFNRRLTLNYGIRFDHVGRWYDRQGVGMAVWMPSQFTTDVAENEGAGSMIVEYPGVRWHGIDPGIPNSGAPTHLLITSPRFGFSYNAEGDGRTVVRGGWGKYVWNDEPLSNPLSTSQNMATFNSASNQAITLAQIPKQSTSGNASPAGSISAYSANDYYLPTTYAWNLTVDRQLPWKTLLEVAYVGNSTQHITLGGESDGVGVGGSNYINVNKIALGGLFTADPVTGASAPSDPDNTATYNIADYHPYSGCLSSGSCYGYGSNSVSVYQHAGYSNYNGLQAAWYKQSGHLTFNFNYTWSKSLGIVDTTLDAYTIHNNYGILAIDRPHVFNASYSYSFDNVYHGSSKIINQAANGWTISGITTIQSGANLQANSSQNLGLTLEKQDSSGNNIETLTSKTYFGTDANSILPVTTCNPKSGLASHQLVKLGCFSAPTIGNQGERVLHPYLAGPYYTDTDLTVYKAFKIHNAQNVEFRASAFDFMNHSLWGLSGTNLVTLKYATKDGGNSFYTSDSVLGVAQSKWGVMDQKTPYSGAGYARIIELSAKFNF
ncbi:carboxypeptidase-like regulatory domain-containing protein [Telmatobacter bradus]|uniref:carboxypeptidase-like regulatory domain-containing protein n=1 Tax=Telmatobacter bradus TaxID=474953 RepID=UPI003B43CD5C